MVRARGGPKVYTFTRKPTGTRRYHSHDIAGKDPTRSAYAGRYEFLIVEPASDPGRYDKEVLLAAHHWEGRWIRMQDLQKGPPPNNGLQVMYAAALFNDKMIGHGNRFASVKASASCFTCSMRAQPKTSGWRFPATVSP
jgi:hypothetical protein